MQSDATRSPELSGFIQVPFACLFAGLIDCVQLSGKMNCQSLFAKTLDQ
jgi:hypothetical protein